MEILTRKGDYIMSKLFFLDIDGTLIDCNQIFMKSHLKQFAL